MIAGAFMFGLALAEANRLADEAFERSIAGLPADEAQRRRERRQDQAAAERRHREQVAALDRIGRRF